METPGGPPVSAVLTGCRVLVTARRRADELAGALEARGAVVAHVPTLSTLLPSADSGRVARTKALITSPPQVVVVSSATAFEEWLRVVRRAGLEDDLLGVLAGSRLVARGPKARTALHGAGLLADWVAEADTAAEVADFLVAEGLVRTRVAVLHHGGGDTGMGAALAGAGATVVPLEVYRWGPPQDPVRVAASARDLGAGCYDAAVFTSAPAAVAWLEALGAAGVTDRVRERVQAGELLLAAVGPVTAE